MSKSTWADVKKHDVVELGGRKWRVVKIKSKGKKATVTVDYKGKEATSVVKLKDRVTFAEKGDGSKKGPLATPGGEQRRWASKKEHDAVLGNEPRGLPAGDPEITKPPKKPGDDVWETPHGRVERLLSESLQARLVAESKDEKAGYYVPPVSISTVASHLVLFHGGIPDAIVNDEAMMLTAHDAQHAEALRGAPLAVNHWHTETRPKA